MEDHEWKPCTLSPLQVWIELINSMCRTLLLGHPITWRKEGTWARSPLQRQWLAVYYSSFSSVYSRCVQ
jgi:hypothetical protein